MLMPIGFDIVEVDNPTKALAILTQETEWDNRPDVILLDVSMPGINGWQLAAQLRAAEYRAPIIMVSADASEGRNQDFMLSPEDPPLHDAYVIKPVRLNVLLDHIGRLLKLTWCYDQTSATTITPKPPIITALQMPEEIHLAGLRQLAVIGHKNGLLQRLQELEEAGVANRNFIEQLRQLTLKFHFEKILNLLSSASLTEKSPETAP